MKSDKTNILYCIILILVIIIIFGFFKYRNTSESLKSTFNNLQSAKDSITTIEQQFNEAGKIIKGLRKELVKELENYNALETEHIKQREIYKEFKITNRSNQESVKTIERFIEQSRIIITELLSKCEMAEN